MPEEDTRVPAEGDPLAPRADASRADALSSSEVDRTLARVPVASLVYDASLRVVCWNPAAEKLLGYAPGDVLGRTPQEVFIPPSSHGTFEQLARGVVAEAASDVGVVHGDCECVARGGRRLWCGWTVTPWLDAAGRRVGGLALIEDASARRDALDRLRASEARNAALLATAPDAIIAIDESGIMESANPAAERLLGYTAAELIGRNVNLLMGSGHEGRHDEYLRRYLTSGVPHVIGIGRDVMARGKDGKDIPVRLSIGETRVGEHRMFIGVLHDLSERRHLEQRLQQAQKMDAVGRLAGGVAHDFNNLLTIMLSASELVLLELPAEHPMRDVIQEIRDAGERGAVLTRQLLALSRRGVPTLTNVDVASLASGMRKMLGRLLGEDIELSVVPSPEPRLVRADTGQLEQVLLNLCINARDAMPSGGTIRVTTELVELDASYARANPDVLPGPYVLLSVSDDGIGMDDETREHLFEPFFTTKERSQGTGLGLATVYGIVTQSGGHVTVDSAPGQGSTFRVYLPRVEDVPGVEPQRRVRTEDLRGTETVLLVEDDGAVRAMARQALAAHGYSVLEAGDGREAVRIEQEHKGPIHLLLTDVVMPRLSGRQVAERLTKARPELRVVYMSGYTNDAVLLRGVSPDTGFLHKPFTPMALARTVRMALDRR